MRLVITDITKQWWRHKATCKNIDKSANKGIFITLAVRCKKSQSEYIFNVVQSVLFGSWTVHQYQRLLDYF